MKPVREDFVMPEHQKVNSNEDRSAKNTQHAQGKNTAANNRNQLIEDDKIKSKSTADRKETKVGNLKNFF